MQHPRNSSNPAAAAPQHQHPNIAVLQKFDPSDISTAKNAFSDNVVFHFFNPQLPDVQGDYVGLKGVHAFFEGMGKRTKGTFHVEPLSVEAVGDELVVAHTRNTMILGNERIETEVVVVWRIVDGRITEVWDIPSVFTAQATPSRT